MLGSLERIGGTPSILWGMGVARKGKHGPADAEGDDRRADASGGDLVPRRGRARRGAARAAELLRVVAELRERRASPGLHAQRRGPCVGPAPGEAVRQRAATSTTASSRSRSRVASRRVSPVLDTSAVKATGGAKVVVAGRHARRGPGPGDDRVRLGRRRGAGRRFLRRRLLTRSAVAPAARATASSCSRSSAGSVTGCAAGVVLAHVRRRFAAARGRPARSGDGSSALAGQRHRRRGAAGW